ncbi:F-box/kelch-repeat protein [Arachis hypogaea]|uniref:F-box/kelch-repeat protein n=1 Tax=Arachis hypogaea TaxID=3818 RepID=A0A6B9V402_ARAHY|nr:F-box/kelch-repeat protein [Arachis hypogaea]
MIDAVRVTKISWLGSELATITSITITLAPPQPPPPSPQPPATTHTAAPLSLLLPLFSPPLSSETTAPAPPLHQSPERQRPPSPFLGLLSSATKQPRPPTFSPAIGSAYAILSSTIYVIGGSINNVPSSHIWLLDCRFHRWRRGPSMPVGREFAATGVVNGKIYVIGSCVADNWARSANWAEVLDPASEKWERVASPAEVREKWMHASAVVDGKVVGTELDLGWRERACVVDDILYCYDYLGKIKGFDVKSRVWKELKGLHKGLPRFLCGATIADLGGKLVVVWECGGGNGKDMDIWCAEIQVSKKNGELWGEVDWFQKVLSVPKGEWRLWWLGRDSDRWG